MKRRSTPLTPLELEIMKVLWDLGPAPVQAVQEKLPGGPLAYTTVQTMLNVLLEKGKVKRTLKSRAFVYRPAVSRLEAVGHTMKDLIDRMFGGSAEALVMGLVETRQLSAEKLDALRRKMKEGDK
jgi:predicted transcriptional regulator